MNSTQQLKLISVIITTYNRAYSLSKTIESVFIQTYDNYEIVVMDNCSTDNTNEVMKKYKNNSKIIYIKNKQNLGRGVNKHNGYLLAQGDYIMFLDDDDYLTNPNYFQNAITAFSKYNIGMYGTSSYIFSAEENKLKHRKLNKVGLISGKSYFKHFQTLYSKPLSTFNAIFSKVAMEETGFENMKRMYDSSIFLRVLSQYDAFLVNEPSGIYNLSISSITKNMDYDFLVENLEEKIQIFNEVDYVKDLWIIKQILLTIYFTLKNSNVTTNDKEKILKWALSQNIHKKVFLYLGLKIGFVLF